MKQSAIRWTLILGVITIIGVSVVQFFFLRQALNQEDKRLDQTIQIALNGVSEQLARYNDADLPFENPVVRLRPDYYVVNVNGFIDGDILEYYLTAELRKRKLNLDFEYGIYDCQTDEMVYGNYISLSDKSGNPSEAPELSKHADYLYYFGVLFPDRARFVLSNLGLWYFFTGILLLVVIFFVLTQIIILRQKRYSEIQKDFINNLTHEFKTPLSSISMAADVILVNDEGPEIPRLKRYGKIIKDQSSHLIGQIDRVLHDSDKGTKSFLPQKEELDLKELIEEVVEQFRPRISKCDGIVKLELPKNPVMIHADRLQLQQVLFNLLDNAEKYCKAYPKITISIVDDGRRGVLSISDEGVGIPEKYQNLVFKRFFRVPQGNIHDVKGFGLGLHFVFRVIKAHRWKLKLISRPDEGTKVDIHFR